MWLLLLMALCLVDTPASLPEAEQRIVQAMEPLLEPYCSETRQADVEVLRLAAELPEHGDMRLLLPHRRRPAGKVQVFIEHRTSEGTAFTRAGYALLRIAWYDSIAVAGERLFRNDHLKADQVKILWKDITRFTGEPLTAGHLRQAMRRGAVRLARTLRKGQVLRRSDLLLPLAADTGTPLLLEIRRPGLHITLSCTARQPGTAGALIRVYCPDTHQHYQARLIAEGKARWIQTLK